MKNAFLKIPSYVSTRPRYTQIGILIDGDLVGLFRELKKKWINKGKKNNISAACSLYVPRFKFSSFPQCSKVPRRKCTKYVPFNLQNSPLQCQNSAQTKVLPARKGAEQCCGMQAVAAMKALCWSWYFGPGPWICLAPSSFPFLSPCLPLFFLLATPDQPKEGAEGGEG